jgi:hypothetical protein
MHAATMKMEAAASVQSVIYIYQAKRRHIAKTVLSAAGCLIYVMSVRRRKQQEESHDHRRKEGKAKH